MTLTSNLRYRVVAVDDHYYWFDRKMNQSIPYENGDEAWFASLDEAILAFVLGKLAVKKNEELNSK